jgi:outer membrane protein assembly factor BamB
MPKIDDSTGFSAPTLCVDAKRVYAIFATGEMMCCTHDGNEVWQKLMPLPDIHYGYASSLLLLGDKLIVQYDLFETQTLYALNVHTGETIWETPREAASSWSSPVALVVDGKAVIFATTNKTAHAFDAKTGDILWTHWGMGGEVATCAFPSPERNAFYFSNASAFTGVFSATDGAILCENGNVPAPDVATPVLFGNKYLLFTSSGSIIALDTENAKELYEMFSDGGYYEFYSSPVIVQDKIVSVDLDGELYLMDAAGDKLVVEGKYSIGKEVVAIPAFHQGNIIVRTSGGELICLEAGP